MFLYELMRVLPLSVWVSADAGDFWLDPAEYLPAGERKAVVNFSLPFLVDSLPFSAYNGSKRSSGNAPGAFLSTGVGLKDSPLKVRGPRIQFGTSAAVNTR